MARGLTKEQGAALLSWLKGNAMEMAADLRDAGWEEDERGLWSMGEHRGMHLLDAAVMQCEVGRTQ